MGIKRTKPGRTVSASKVEPVAIEAPAPTEGHRLVVAPRVTRTRPKVAMAPLVERLAKVPAGQYLILQAWNLFLNGPRMYNVDKAKEEGAPEDAIFWRFAGGWAQLIAIETIHTRHPFYDYLDKFLTENGA